MENDKERVEKWNEILCEVIRRIDWGYLYLNQHSLNILENIDDYRKDPIGISLAQLRIFSFDQRDKVSKDIIKEILRIYNYFQKYSRIDMQHIDESLLDIYITHFTGVINDIRNYLDNN